MPESDILSSAPIVYFRSLLEIVIITLMVYAFFRFLRGTRGAGVARGLTVLNCLGFVFALFVVDFLRLENIRWLLESLMGSMLLALVVIFQPEFRRGLIKLGEGVAVTILKGKDTSVEREICDAAFSISRKREVGALFVIEREARLDDYIDSGVRLDAEVSNQLLRTIFTHNTPLHDGAAIMREGRLAAANCLLPLSENIEACRGMGTRHRAAIGLSEDTDALVVVVSEETGAVSVAAYGQLRQGLDSDELLRYLRENNTEAAGNQQATAEHSGKIPE